MNEQTGDSEKRGNPARPPRRSGSRRRGGRGRGRGQQNRETNLPTAEGAAATENPIVAPVPNQPVSQAVSHQPRPQQKHSALSPIAKATEQVEQIIQTLKDSLRELEEVLEILDDAQRQQIGDTKEIEKLRRSLSMLQRERSSAPREDTRGRSENRNRPTGQRSPTESPADEPEE
jgi:hypothetical protein